MKNCKIFKESHFWHVVVLSKEMGEFIVLLIKQKHFPIISYITYRGDFGSAIYGGLNLEIQISEMAEEEDLSVLETTIENLADTFLKLRRRWAILSQRERI